MSKLILKDIKYTYLDGNRKKEVLKGLNATFDSGKLNIIIGESGSGKTTLLSLISGLDKLQEGDILFNDISIKNIGNDAFRLFYVNVVFQAYNLITYMTARENVEIAIDIAGIKTDDNKAYAYKLLEDVGIDKDTSDQLVLSLSGGEQQRVAIARAVASDVPIIVADEPTGNLDEETEDKIMDIFRKLKKQDKIIIIVSHSKKVAEEGDKVYHLKKGIIE